MNKRKLTIAILISIFAFLSIYGVKIFESINYNRKVFETDIYEYIPNETNTVINFSRDHHFEEYFKIDSTNSFLISHLKDYITYPLLIVKGDAKHDLLIAKATKKQEEIIRSILEKEIAPHHAPQKKVYHNYELNIYSLPDNNFITAIFTEGLFAISLDYRQIESFINNKFIENLIKSKDAQTNHTIKKIYETSPISVFIKDQNTKYALSYTFNKDNVFLEGQYFGQLEEDSIKLSYNKINNLLHLNNHYTDSIDWEDHNRLRIWINKVE